MAEPRSPEVSPIVKAAVGILQENKPNRFNRLTTAQTLGLSLDQSDRLDEAIIQAEIGLRKDGSLSQTTLQKYIEMHGMPYATPAWMSGLSTLNAELKTKKNGLELKDYVSRMYPDKRDVLRFLGVAEEDLPPLPQSK